MYRLALALEYDGTAYKGWQKQQGLATIQQSLEFAISKLANHPISTTCAGRTDAGVHAVGQVVHFDVEVSRAEHVWISGVNSYLPKDIRVLSAKFVANNFDARRSALFRRYCYIIYNAKIRPALFRNQVSFYYHKLDENLMCAAAQHWLGEHDFSSFRDSDCQSLSPIRKITSVNCFRAGDLVIFTVTANAFLHHMIRNMVGVLLEIGKQQRPTTWAADVLASKDRKSASITAQAAGLYLLGVDYPEEFAITTINNVPWVFQNIGI